MPSRGIISCSNGKPYQVIAGEMHYARIPREYWRTRMQMAKAMGLNTIATYVFWNVHEPTPGVYDFSGNYDLAAFIKLASGRGPARAAARRPVQLRGVGVRRLSGVAAEGPEDEHARCGSNDPAFMVPAERWIKRLAQETGPLLIENGGPIIAVQIENEYGNFSNDQAYMQHMLRNLSVRPAGRSRCCTRSIRRRRWRNG